VRRVVALAALVLLAAGCNGGTVDHHAIKQDADTLGSIATEGQLLANDVSKGASTRYFARVHSGELAQAASNFEDALGERPTLPDIETKVRAASRLAGKISVQLDRLHEHPTNRLVAQQVQQKLADLSDQADKLAK
jgi:hypothetical protein